MGEDLSSLLSNMAQLGIEINTQEEIIVATTVNEILIEEPEAGSSDQKRSLRKRSASSDDTLHRIRNRKIQKPKKNAAGSMQFESEKEVKNFYLNINKKFKQVKPQLLETIYEMDETVSDVDESETNDTSRTKKQKRTMTICDGLNITKALKDKRKGLIRKHLGNKKKPKKMAFHKFMEYFKDKSDGVMDAVAIEW
jgi:hypothetical protein